MSKVEKGPARLEWKCHEPDLNMLQPGDFVKLVSHPMTIFNEPLADDEEGHMDYKVVAVDGEEILIENPLPACRVWIDTNLITHYKKG